MIPRQSANRTHIANDVIKNVKKRTFRRYVYQSGIKLFFYFFKNSASSNHLRSKMEFREGVFITLDHYYNVSQNLLVLSTIGLMYLINNRRISFGNLNL